MLKRKEINAYICEMKELRIKEVAKSKGLTMLDIAEKLGITYTALNRRLHTAKMDTLKSIAKILQCEIAELIRTSKNYSHFYDEDKEWQGIRKK